MFDNTTSSSRKDLIARRPYYTTDTHRWQANPTEINVSKDVCSVAFLSNGRHIVCGGFGGKVRVWKAGEGQEVGTAFSAGSTTILNVAVSQDGRWLAVGTGHGQVLVWDAECPETVVEFQGHANWVRAVDISPDTSKIASGSDDKTVCVWSVTSSERPLLGPLEHDYILAAVKFSPNGDLLATATWWKESVRIYDSREGNLLFDLAIRVNSYENQSLAWLLNSTVLFALSSDGHIKYFDVLGLGLDGTMHSEWPVYANPSNNVKCMVVADNGKFLAVSVNSLVFFWDTATHQQIGSGVTHTDTIRSIAISSSYVLAVGGGKRITIQNLFDILPSHYIDDRTCDMADLILGKTAAVATNGFVKCSNGIITSLEESTSNGASNLHDEYLQNDLTNFLRRDGRDPVASGGFADIYRGVLHTHWEPMRVAIKAIRTYSGDDGSYFKKQKRLHREIKVWLTLEHVNIIPLLGTAAGFGRFPAMVCPWVDNGSLTSYLEDHYDKLSVVQVLTLLNDAASGLQYLHSCSVVHGDLSGSNVLVSKDGRAYISDFGLSTLLTELGGPTFATSVHERGTLRWTAPELLDLDVSEDEVESSKVMPTKHGDVYSFGGVMLQTLTGKVPYHYYAREVQVVHAVSRGITPRRPSSALVTDRRWIFIQGCWSTVNPSQTRPSSDNIAHFTNDELARAKNAS